MTREHEQRQRTLIYDVDFGLLVGDPPRSQKRQKLLFFWLRVAWAMCMFLSQTKQARCISDAKITFKLLKIEYEIAELRSAECALFVKFCF